MENQKLDTIVSKMFAEIEKLTPVNTKSQNDKNMTKLSVGFSSFNGIVDLEIMMKALDKVLYHN